MIDRIRNPHRAALEDLARNYANIGTRSRMGLRITLGDNMDSYTVAVVGVIREKQQLVLRAPVNADGSLIAVLKGQSLHCHWMNATTAFQFRAMIVRIQFEPTPLVYVELPQVIECRTLRGVPRALTALRSLVKTPEEIEAVIVDLSTGGARLAVHDEVYLDAGQNILLQARPRVLGREFHLSLECQIAGPITPPDPEHPQIKFYGATFKSLSDNELLILHSCVQEGLAMETDTLSQMLLLNAKEMEEAE